MASPLLFLDGSNDSPERTRAVLDAVAEAIEARVGAAPHTAAREVSCPEGDACPRALDGEPRVVIRLIAVDCPISQGSDSWCGLPSRSRSLFLRFPLAPCLRTDPTLPRPATVPFR